MNNEIWKPIMGYEGYYEVSNLGRIKSLSRVVQSKHGGTYPVGGRIMVGTPTNLYLCITLCRSGEQKRVGIHRLVAQAFIPNPENKRTVNHKDFDKSNNHVDNLEWATYQENLGHFYATEWSKNGPNDRKPVTQLTPNREVIAIFRSITDAARVNWLNEDCGGLCDCINRKAYKDGTYKGYRWELA